jgi:energy-coupling factor transporter ATP-binding protein EcfA2
MFFVLLPKFFIQIYGEIVHISHIQVEGGFLGGLDLELSSGLNVLIGARGTGKTSVIELIRYALNAKSHTYDSEKKSLDHAKAVLSGGEVSLSLSDNNSEYYFSRGSDDNYPQSNHNILPPIVLSQTEIETIGLSQSGRLALIDGFIQGNKNSKWEREERYNSLKSLFNEIKAKEKEIENLQENLNSIVSLQNSILELEKKDKLLKTHSAETLSKQHELNLLNDKLSLLTQKEFNLGRILQNSISWSNLVSDKLCYGDSLETASDLDEDLDVFNLTKELKSTENLFEIANSKMTLIASKCTEYLGYASEDKIKTEKNAKVIRHELENLSEGAGLIARELFSRKKELSNLLSKENWLLEQKDLLNSLRLRRDEILQSLIKIQDNRFENRKEVINNLNNLLSPFIKLNIEQSSQFEEYKSTIIDSLKGSNLRYKDIANVISKLVSPIELVHMVDSQNFEELSEITGLPADRSARVLGHLQEKGLIDIAICDVEDNVNFMLLDGKEYKNLLSLSAGQRCTVILSIVLQHSERILVIDQPEDHLDNAFIANTVIKSLKQCKANGQVILSTHNANIPVLGGADLVIELTSDGRNGHVEVCENLEHEKSIKAITNVMEGGLAAFQSRAQFYKKF